MGVLKKEKKKKPDGQMNDLEETEIQKEVREMDNRTTSHDRNTCCICHSYITNRKQ